MSNRQIQIGITSLIAFVGLIVGATGTIAITSVKVGRDQQVLAETERRSRTNSDRIATLEYSVSELPYIRRDVDIIRKLLEKEASR